MISLILMRLEVRDSAPRHAPVLHPPKQIDKFVFSVAKPEFNIFLHQKFIKEIFFVPGQHQIHVSCPQAVTNQYLRRLDN